jgi:hypothetical protein
MKISQDLAVAVLKEVSSSVKKYIGENAQVVAASGDTFILETGDGHKITVKSLASLELGSWVEIQESLNPRLEPNSVILRLLSEMEVDQFSARLPDLPSLADFLESSPSQSGQIRSDILALAAAVREWLAAPALAIKSSVPIQLPPALTAILSELASALNRLLPQLFPSPVYQKDAPNAVPAAPEPKPEASLPTTPLKLMNLINSPAWELMAQYLAEAAVAGNNLLLDSIPGQTAAVPPRPDLTAVIKHLFAALEFPEPVPVKVSKPLPTDLNPGVYRIIKTEAGPVSSSDPSPPLLKIWLPGLPQPLTVNSPARPEAGPADISKNILPLFIKTTAGETFFWTPPQFFTLPDSGKEALFTEFPANGISPDLEKILQPFPGREQMPLLVQILQSSPAPDIPLQTLIQAATILRHTPFAVHLPSWTAVARYLSSPHQPPPLETVLNTLRDYLQSQEGKTLPAVIREAGEKLVIRLQNVLTYTANLANPENLTRLLTELDPSREQRIVHVLGGKSKFPLPIATPLKDRIWQWLSQLPSGTEAGAKTAEPIKLPLQQLAQWFDGWQLVSQFNPAENFIPLPVAPGQPASWVRVSFRKERGSGRTRKKNTATLRLEMETSRLGPVRADFALSGRALRVQFQLASENIRTRFFQGQSALRERLEAQGLETPSLEFRLLERGKMSSPNLGELSVFPSFPGHFEVQA